MRTMGMDLANLEMREWLTVNGRGGFASGTVGGIATRRYHALLIASLPPPQNRQMVLGALDVTVAGKGFTVALAAHRYTDGTVYPDGWRFVTSYDNWPVPTWTYRLPGNATLIKQIFFARGRNTVYVTLQMVEGTEPLSLTLAPLVGWRSYHDQQRQTADFPRHSAAIPDGWQIQASDQSPVLRLLTPDADWEKADWWNRNLRHEREQERGFDSAEDLYCPATAQVVLTPGETVAFVATVESDAPDGYRSILAEHAHHQDRCLNAAGSPDDPALQDLVLSGDQCIITAHGGRATILAGYPWFTDWGRDTMIALPGLCLATGRHSEAREILRGFAGWVSDGMIPNRFPDQGETPEYNTADATLWWVHASNAYAVATNDRQFQRELLPALTQVLEQHVRGTRYRIRMDTRDALLGCGEPGVQLTWMDAKVGDWVVTPRRGKPVEINALWVHALTVAGAWCEATGQAEAAYRWRGLAARARASFRLTFVRPDGRGLYDVLPHDAPPDAAIRPNQLVAVALDSQLLEEKDARSVVETVEAELLTPFGLRTLSPHHPLYHERYEGNGRARDSAYHQGTAWPYLLGIYTDACRRVYGSDFDAHALFAPLLDARDAFGVSGIAEIFDGDAPQRPNGCPWQAWSIAEALRVLLPLG